MAITILRGGFRTKDPRLDRIPEFDSESLNYRVRKTVVRGVPIEDREIVSQKWMLNAWLDQGQEGRCVEFGICHDLLADPEPVEERPLVETILANKLIYWPAQREDQWPGGSYPDADPGGQEGTSVLAGVKVAKRLGFYGQYRWATTLEGALLGLSHIGPLILGLNWYEGLSDTDADGWVHYSGEMTGGHCLLAVAGRIYAVPGFEGAIVHADQIDKQRSYLVLHNSWGKSWGKEGRAKLSVADFDKLRKEDGEVCIACERQTPDALPTAA